MAKYHQGLFKPRYPQKYVGTLPICFRRGWEAKAFRYLDHHPRIVAWASESVIVPYQSPIDLRIHRYFTDLFFVVEDAQKKRSTFLIEIKPYAQTQMPTTKPTTPRRRLKLLAESTTYAVNQSKWTAAKKYAEERGWQFVVVTEKELYKLFTL